MARNNTQYTEKMVDFNRSFPQWGTQFAELTKVAFKGRVRKNSLFAQVLKVYEVYFIFAQFLKAGFWWEIHIIVANLALL